MGFFGSGNKVTVQIVGDKGKLDKELRGAAKDVDQFGKKSSKSLVTASNLIKAALAGVAAKAVFNFVGGTISAFSDLNESMNAVEVTFGDAADGIKALGEGAAESLGLANSEFNTLAVGFAAFVDQIAAEKDGDVVATMDELTTRVADFASVMNIDVTEAANKFRSGLAGETEPLRKFGLDMSAAAVKVRGLELGLGDVSGTLSEQEKILVRYNLLMEQTEKVAGDFANTSGDLANATRILSSKWEDAQAVIGEALIPTLEDMFPLLEKGIDVVIDLAVGFGMLTGSISNVDAAIRRAKLGIDDETTSIDVLRLAMENLQKELTGMDRDAFFGIFGESSLEVEKLIGRFGNLAETFDLTADDADFLRENAEELAEEWGTTEDAVLSLADRLDTDPAQAMRNISAKEGVKLLENTQDIRDAVLDGLDPALGRLGDTTEEAEEAAKALGEAEEEQAEALDKAAQAVRDKRDALLEVHDPLFNIFRLTQDLEEAELAVIEAENEFTRDSAEFVGAVMDRANILSDLRITFDVLLAEGINPTGEAARNMFRGLGVPDDVIDKIFGVFDEIQTNLRDRLFSIDVRANFLGLDPGSPVPDPNNIVRIARHTGGRVNAPRGQEVLVRALGGETFSNPAHSNGGGGGASVQILPVFVGSTTQLAAEIDRMLTKRSRTSGLGF